MWLQEYAQSPVNQYEWSEESYTNLDKYQTMMTRLYRQELKQCIEQYEVSHVTSLVTSRHVTSNHVTSDHVTSDHVTSDHVTSRHMNLYWPID